MPIKWVTYELLRERDGLICMLCGKSIEKEYHSLETWFKNKGKPRQQRKKIPINIDHIIPKSKKASTGVNNLQITHYKCNLWKENKTRRNKKRHKKI